MFKPHSMTEGKLDFHWFELLCPGAWELIKEKLSKKSYTRRQRSLYLGRVGGQGQSLVKRIFWVFIVGASTLESSSRNHTQRLAGLSKRDPRGTSLEPTQNVVKILVFFWFTLAQEWGRAHTRLYWWRIFWTSHKYLSLCNNGFSGDDA